VSVLLFLNELSCAQPHSKVEVNEAMKNFVGLLRQIVRLRSDAALVSAVKREELELSPGYYLAEWAGQSANKDLWRFIRSVQNRAPFQAVLSENAETELEYLWNGKVAAGLGAAHQMGGLLTSLLVDDCWDTPWIPAVRYLLSATDDGEDDFVEDEVQVRHAAGAGHMTVHESWLRQAGVMELMTGLEIWQSCPGMYPSLQFLPRTEEQFRELRPEWVRPLALELRRIDDAVADWDPSQRPIPGWRSHVTTEHETRRRLCEFADLDGKVRTFDWHGRFTPGAGRVYFRLVPEERKARIANVGLKLGI
jgi:hypothetical protein